MRKSQNVHILRVYFRVLLGEFDASLECSGMNCHSMARGLGMDFKIWKKYIKRLICLLFLA